MEKVFQMPQNGLVGNSMLILFTNVAAGNKVGDMQSGFWGYSRGLCRGLRLQKGYWVDPQILLDNVYSKIHVGEKASSSIWHSWNYNVGYRIAILHSGTAILPFLIMRQSAIGTMLTSMIAVLVGYLPYSQHHTIHNRNFTPENH